MAANDHLSGGQFWHGSPSGDTRGSHYGLHVGTRQAASEALNARIGVPHEGEWDGTREYGKTLLQSSSSGYGVGAPKEPHYPTGQADYSDRSKVPLDARPSIFPVKITGPMTNTPSQPHEDFKANGMMAGQLKRGRAKSGYFYQNVGEDSGSISAVVPGASHVKRLDVEAARIMLGGPK